MVETGMDRDRIRPNWTVATLHHGKIFPKKEIKTKVVDFTWLIINLKKSCDLLYSLLSYTSFKPKIHKSVTFKSVFLDFSR